MDEPDQPGASSRRAFLKGAAGAAVGMGVLGAAAAGPAGATTVPPHVTGVTGFSGTALGSGSSPHPPPHRPLPAHAHYNRHRFEGAKGARVTVTLPEGPVTITIDDIEPLGVAEGAKAGSALWRDAFRVTLKGPRGTSIPQGTHPVSINGRQFDLFLVPIMSTGGSNRYEAVIHRAYHRRAHG